jgi:hypothetical protein
LLEHADVGEQRRYSALLAEPLGKLALAWKPIISVVKETARKAQDVWGFMASPP